MRSVLMFLSGFIAGMLFLIVLLWSHGSLRTVRAAGNGAAAEALPAREPIAAAPAKTPAAPPEVRASQQRPTGLILPIQGVDPSKILDTFEQIRGQGRHEAVDIMAPRGTPVLAVEDGTVEKLFESKRGGTTIYQFDPTCTWSYYYAHLDRYALGIAQGAKLRKGQVIGYVGSTGDASPEAPHLHFAIFKLGPEKHWWQGTPINPYPILVRHARQ